MTARKKQDRPDRKIITTSIHRNMKFIFQLFGIAIAAHMLEIFLPWYSIAAAAFVVGYALKTNANFLAGFLGIALLWLFKAWLMDAAADTDLTERVSRIFNLPHKAFLFLIMAIIGGLIGGFAAQAGSLLKKDVTTFKEPEENT